MSIEPTTFTPDWVVHPGATLAEVMEQDNRDTWGLSTILDVPRLEILAVLTGLRGISPEMAKRLGGRGLGTEQFWLNLQANYERDCARLGFTPNDGKLHQSVYQKWQEEETGE